MNFTRIEVVKNECQSNSAKSDLEVQIGYRCVDYEKSFKDNAILYKNGDYESDTILNCGPYYAKLQEAEISADGGNLLENIADKVNAAMIRQANITDESKKEAVDKFPLNRNFKSQGGDQRFVIFPIICKVLYNIFQADFQNSCNSFQIHFVNVIKINCQNRSLKK